MDLGFFRRAQQRFAVGSPAHLDYGVLVATLEALQSASPTARAALGGGVSPHSAFARHQALAELVLGGPAWRGAIATRGGSFNPAFAGFRGKGA